MVTRRKVLQALLWGAEERKRIAAVVTEYRRNSHADVIVGRLLEGYEYDGARRQPQVRVVSMYTDQVPANDMSRAMAARHGVKICATVRDAVEVGVDGVLLVGEHGNYPDNARGQKLYPRYELFRQIVEAGARVPVFCDKHLSVEWEKAKWMYDQAREQGVALMAGSSLPVTWRRPPVDVEYGAPLQHAVVTFYGPKEAYGFHALETLQCMVERRRGGETGIAAVECVEGPAVWKWTEANPWAARLLEAALAHTSDRKPGAPRDNVKRPMAFLLDYRDGLRAAVYMLDGHVQQAAFATDRLTTEVWLQQGRPFSHFSALVHYIEQLMVTAKAPYPVERTLLTTGSLAALMEGGRVETPQLAIRYRAPRQSLFARGPVPALEEKS